LKVSLLVVAVAAVSLTGCSGARRPAATEFGLGPRSSAHGQYVATLEPASPLRPRRMQTVRVVVVDGQGQAVDGATLAIDGGMPQHGHGLPTRPRVTGSLGAGVYQVEGLRFNMGGWWELRLTISAGAGDDTITFNLAL
jgi:hypothetical protein